MSLQAAIHNLSVSLISCTHFKQKSIFDGGRIPPQTRTHSLPLSSTALWHKWKSRKPRNKVDEELFCCIWKRNTSQRHVMSLTLLHSEGPKLYGVLALLSAIGLMPSSQFGQAHFLSTKSERVQFKGRQLCHFQFCIPSVTVLKGKNVFLTIRTGPLSIDLRRMGTV